MYEVKQYSNYDKNIPQDIQDYFNFTPEAEQYFSMIAIYKYGKLVDGYCDMIETEDATFDRGLSWVRYELEKAYKQGKEDGQIELYK